MHLTVPNTIAGNVAASNVFYIAIGAPVRSVLIGLTDQFVGTAQLKDRATDHAAVLVLLSVQPTTIKVLEYEELKSIVAKAMNLIAFPYTLRLAILSSLVFILLILLTLGRAWSILVSPTDQYEEASPEIVETLRSIKNTATFFKNAEPTVFTMTASSRSKNKHVFIRFETKDCKDICMNAIFKGVVSENSFVAFAFLPRKSAVGDAARGICRSCPSHFPLIFRADDEQGRAYVKGLYLTDHGIAF